MMKQITWDSLPKSTAEGAKKRAISLLKERLKMPGLSEDQKQKLRGRIQKIARS